MAGQATNWIGAYIMDLDVYVQSLPNSLDRKYNSWLKLIRITRKWSMTGYVHMETKIV